MINKNGKCINKYGICLNVLLHYGQYKKLVGLPIIIRKNDGLEKYDKLIGKTGYVVDFEYTNFDKPLIVRIDKKEYCFSSNEIESRK